MMIEKIISDIDEKQDEILSNLDNESVVVYIFLKKEFDKSNITNNLLFQFVFRSFYRLDNAGLSDNLKKHFFKLLAEKQTKLDIILSDLYEIPRLKKDNSIQFSFATKLLHTVDNDKPIFDKYIEAISLLYTPTIYCTVLYQIITVYSIQILSKLSVKLDKGFSELLYPT